MQETPRPRSRPGPSCKPTCGAGSALSSTGQSRHAFDHDDVGGAVRVVGARDGSVRTRPNGPRMQTEGKKRSPHSGRARNSMGDSRAPFRASPIVAEKTRPPGCKHQDISERTARKANRARRSFAHHEGLSYAPRLMINPVAAADSSHL